MINGWNIIRTEDKHGVDFVFSSAWEATAFRPYTDDLNDFVIKGIYRDGGDLLIPIVKSGIFKVLKIEAGAVKKLDVPSVGFKLMLKEMQEKADYPQQVQTDE